MDHFNAEALQTAFKTLLKASFKVTFEATLQDFILLLDHLALRDEGLNIVTICFLIVLGGLWENQFI